MIKATYGGKEFTIKDNQVMTGGNTQAKKDYEMAKSIEIRISEGPVAAVLFNRMDSIRDGYSLKERIDPEGVF